MTFGLTGIVFGLLFYLAVEAFRQWRFSARMVRLFGDVANGRMSEAAFFEVARRDKRVRREVLLWAMRINDMRLYRRLIEHGLIG